jgi:nucleoid DNA-binding protein
MTKIDLIKNIQKNIYSSCGSKVSLGTIKEVLDALDDEIVTVIAKEDKYTFKFGTVKGVRKNARLGINPNNGEQVIWPEKIIGKMNFGRAISNLNEEDEE